jgi:hypothetical protein
MSAQPHQIEAVVDRQGDDLRAVVRTIAGIFDVELRSGRWSCSCGLAPHCRHCSAVLAALADVEAGEAKP